MEIEVKANRLLWLLILLALLPPHAAALDYPNRYNSMAETLFDMMDAFSSAYQRRLRERAWDYAGQPGYAPHPATPYPATPYPPPYPSGGAPVAPPGGVLLDGSWQGEGGEILVIRRDLFRIYLDRDNFRDGRLAQVEPRVILLQDLESGQVRPYEFAESTGRLLLRDADGNLLRYIRIGW